MTNNANFQNFLSTAAILLLGYGMNKATKNNPNWVETRGALTTAAMQSAVQELQDRLAKAQQPVQTTQVNQ